MTVQIKVFRENISKIVVFWKKKKENLKNKILLNLLFKMSKLMNKKKTWEKQFLKIIKV